MRVCDIRYEEGKSYKVKGKRRRGLCVSIVDGQWFCESRHGRIACYLVRNAEDVNRGVREIGKRKTHNDGKDNK